MAAPGQPQENIAPNNVVDGLALNQKWPSQKSKLQTLTGPSYTAIERELVALGETIDARTALQFGIANRVVPLERLHAEAATIAQRLAKLPAGSLAATKRLMRNPEVLTAQIAAESECFAERLTTAEAREAFTAFAERRPPDFAKLAR